MKIIADQEAVETLTQMSDALLKAYWNKGLWLANSVLSKIEHEDQYDVKKKKIEKEKTKK